MNEIQRKKSKPLACWFGFHKENIKFIPVFQSEFVNTDTVIVFCERCKKTLDIHGSTTLGPIHLKIK